MEIYQYKKLGWRCDFVVKGVKKFVAGFTKEEVEEKLKKMFPLVTKLSAKCECR